MSEQEKNRRVGVGLVGLGGFFLFTQIFNISLWGLIWPFFIILPGVPFLYGALNDRSGKNAGLIFPGLIISGTGLILLYQSLTGHWESWAYIWTLYPVFVGLGLQFEGERSGDRGNIQTGKGMVRYGLMALAGLAFLFEFIIFGNIFGGLTGLLWPLVLMGGGYYMLTQNRNESEPAKNTPKRKYAEPSADISPDLKRKIEEVLAEDDDEPEISQGNNLVDV